MKKLILLLVVSITFTSVTMAQESKKSQKKMMPRELATTKVDFLAKKAGLSDSEKEVFKKIHAEYSESMKVVRTDFHKWNSTKKEEAKDQKIDYRQSINDVFTTKEKMLELEKGYIHNLSEKLSPEKAYKIMRAEVMFHRYMVKGINSRYKIKALHKKHVKKYLDTTDEKK